MKIFTVFAQVRPPKNGARGRYTVIDGFVTLCDREGKIVRDQLGRTYTHALKDGASAHVIAARLTKNLRLVLLGKDPTASARKAN
jgi:hypothetical protein